MHDICFKKTSFFSFSAEISFYFCSLCFKNHLPLFLSLIPSLISFSHLNMKRDLRACVVWVWDLCVGLTCFVGRSDIVHVVGYNCTARLSEHLHTHKHTAMAALDRVFCVQWLLGLSLSGLSCLSALCPFFPEETSSALFSAQMWITPT